MKPKKIVPFPGKHMAQGEIADETLIRAIAQGDGNALGTLFERHSMAVFRFLARMSKVPQQELDDLVQETFIQVGKSARRFKGKSSGKTWILGISANVLRRHCRTQGRRMRFLHAFKSETKTKMGAAIDFEARRILANLPNAIKELPEPLRLVFVMCALEQVPSKEVAEVLGIPHGTVRRRLHQARKHLEKLLSRCQS